MPKVKQATKECPELSNFPNFHKSGSIIGMKNKYYGRDALLIRKGNYIYNVSDEPEYYNNPDWCR